MAPAILEALKSDSMEDLVACLSTPGAIYKVLRKAPEVEAVRLAIQNGTLAEGDVRQFTKDLLDATHPGERLPHETALAAIAVALEDRATDFSREFLTEIAGLQLAEVAMASRVARLCLKQG